MKKHILIVDDEKNTCYAMERAMINCGYKVSIAMNGIEGMEIIRNSLKSGDRIDLAVIDVQLPGMSGAGLIRALKTEDIPIPYFALSGTLDKRFLINLLNAGGASGFERAWPGHNRGQRVGDN
jgi:CheY-like chemotaxis protein